MRVFGRFLYAMFAVGVFLLAWTYSIDLMRQNYYQDVFGASLVDENSALPDYYYFYSSMPDYHKDDPVINVDQNGYQVRGYEIARTIFDEDDNLEINEFLFILVYSDSQNLSNLDYLVLSENTGDDELKIKLIRYYGLEIRVSIDDNMSYYLIPKELFLEADFDKLEVLDSSENALVSVSAFSIAETDFTIKDNIEDYYLANGELPTSEDMDELAADNIYPRDSSVASNDYLIKEYIHIFWIAMGIYFTVLIFATYFIFFRKQRGRGKHSLKDRDAKEI
ncbi:MAG: hypothetical protein K9L64_07360 [Candidatus Izimaplasma sp.]|nr:hypothetical protein [Candidatus Izimaplasma bacterium]